VLTHSRASSTTHKVYAHLRARVIIAAQSLKSHQTFLD
jgi:hypothetical protein